VSPDILHHLDRQRDEWSDYDVLDLVPRGECYACGDATETPPVCRDCALADEESARAYRTGREW
jgi:hypothetical protein